METIYQSLVAVEPLTLIANICNLFIQMLIIKKFFLDKIVAVLDQRRSAADKEITDAEKAKQEAMEIKKTYEDNMLQANAKANEILTTAQKTAAERSDKIIGEAQQAAAQIKSKASADIAQEKKKAINDAKNEISGLALAIAGKVVEKELAGEDQAGLIDRFIDRWDWTALIDRCEKRGLFNYEFLERYGAYIPVSALRGSLLWRNIVEERKWQLAREITV